MVDEGLSLERGILLALVLSALLGWGFLELAGEMREGEVQRLDDAIYAFLHTSQGPLAFLVSARVTEAVRDVTALGSYSIIGAMTALVCGYLAVIGRPRTALFVLVAVVSGVVVSQGLKFFFGRPRPELADPHAQVFTASFPSGHSLMSAVVYLTLGSLLARLQTAWRAKAFVLGAAVLITIMVGLSRLLLGVHWPTDILAGWAIGASWALLCWAVFLYLQRRRTLGVVASQQDEGPPAG